MSVSLAATNPAVHDSAVAMRRPASSAADLIVDQRAVFRKDLARMVFAQDAEQFRIHRRRIRLVAGDDLELAAAQAGGDLQPLEPVDLSLRVAQRLGEARLGQPEHPDHVLPVLRPARDGLL